ncbi:MAG: DNA-processing protein DprA [Candidatus Paceibacterota bacterium]
MEGMISIEDRKYPEKLRGIKNPPKNIYYKGSHIWNRQCLAVIGSRNCSPEIRKTIDKIIKGLEEQVVVVSGLARGVDSYAHSSAVKNGKGTIAVLPCGIGKIYPKENETLARKIIENDGLIVSEYPDKTKPTKFSFIQRNRITAGLSSAILVAEAQMKSGTMHTVRFAEEQGKTIYAIPGSEGTDYLILNGAIPVLEPGDICL